MELIYLSDVHDDFDRVKDLLSLTDADVYVISGDLIDKPFYTTEMAVRYRLNQAAFARLRRRLGYADLDAEGFVEAVTSRDDLPGDVKERAREFREETIRGRRVMQQKYKILESVLRRKKRGRVLCLPGNYDMDLQYTSLHERDLHRHWHQLGEVRIAGYGGADVFTPGIPERYTVKYRADRGVSEMVRFLREAAPDVVVTHKPAHGVLDYLVPTGESGSPDLRRFCDESGVILCLTGHLHDQAGFQEVDGTVYLNPSNFGTITTPGGDLSEGGFFYSVEIQGRRLVRMCLRKIVGDGIHDLVVHEPRPGSWSREVLDQERYGAHLRAVGYAADAPPPKTKVRERLLSLMRCFYPGGAGMEGLEGLGGLFSAAAALEGRLGVEVGLDLVGGTGGVGEVVAYVSSSDGDREGLLGAVREGLSNTPGIVVVDVIHLSRVRESIAAGDYECDALQRFAAYRAVGRLVRPGRVPEAEGDLASDPVFRGEIEGTGSAYMEIFLNVAAAVGGLGEFDAVMRELGITPPEAFRRRIAGFIHGRA